MQSDAFSTSTRNEGKHIRKKLETEKARKNSEASKANKPKDKLDEMWLKSENGNSRHTDNNELVCLVDWWKSQMSRKMPFIVYHIYRWWVSLWYAKAWYGMVHIFLWIRMPSVTIFMYVPCVCLSPPFVSCFFSLSFRILHIQNAGVRYLLLLHDKHIADQKKSNEACVLVCDCVCTEEIIL